MAYYAAVISLKQTIQRLLNSSQIRIFPKDREILEFASKKVSSLQEFLQRLEKDGISNSSSNSEKVNALNGEIREAVCKLEDALESHVSNQFLISQSESSGIRGSSLRLSLDLEELKHEITSFTTTVKKIEKQYRYTADVEYSNPLREKDDAVSSGTHFGAKKSKMVGFSNQFRHTKYLLTQFFGKDLDIVSLWGMAGIGKTTLANEIYDDKLILDHFNCRVWATIGQRHQLEKVFLTDKSGKEGEEILVADLYVSLKGRKYLIVVDDVWNKEDWDKLEKLLPDDKNGSRVLLTTRLEKVAKHADRCTVFRQMHLLDEEESWHLLREKVFGKESLCPPQLQNAGKKIAEKCEGLPLTIVTVAKLLSRAEKTPEYWNKVAEEKENSLFIDAYNEMSNVLLPSYTFLPQHLKACFLYMGVFPPRCEITASKLINLWNAEGFLETKWPRDLQNFGMECLEELASASVILVHQRCFSAYRIKTCSIQSVYCYLCKREAEKEKFFHVINSFANSFTHGIRNQRRLCVHNNALFGIKEVHNSMKCISMAHSLLCTGPHHQYPVPICFGLRLLRVLDALTIRFYKFPIEVLKLVHLRYLALTCNGNVPPSISNLWNLECFTVRQHLSIKSSGDNSLFLLPVEICDMKELRHLRVMGSNLRNPCGTAHLPNLLTLSDMSADICSKEILERIPNLKRLGIQIELEPDTAELLFCFDHLSHLHKLESLKCIVVNPNLMTAQVVAPLTCNIILPSNLKKLSLSGLGYPWKEMRRLAKLPNLRSLKLRCYAFRGPVWEIYEGEFKNLQFLLLEDTDLVHWSAHCLPYLFQLTIRHCYKLKTIPSMTIERMEIEDCPSVLASVEKNVSCIDISVHSTWDESKLKSTT